MEVTWETWVTLATMIAIIATLIFELAAPDLAFLLAATLLTLIGILKPHEAFAGFSNTGLLTVAALYVVAAGLRETGILEYVGRYVLGRVKTELAALIRLSGILITISAFLNNTPVVAMFTPIVIDWCRRHQIAPSRLLIPVSYLTILGGTCTLIGTSTNLIVDGQLRAEYARKQAEPLPEAPPANKPTASTKQLTQEDLQPFGLFEITPMGLLYALVGVGYLGLVGRFLLPRRDEFIEKLGAQRREYMVSMRVLPECRLVGKTIDEAGLRSLTGLFLVEIQRGGQVLAPVSPRERLLAEDQLLFAGVVESVVELERIEGLVPTADETYLVEARHQRNRLLCEAVISQSSPLVGKTIREAEFRAAYNAAVLAVHRHGARVFGKIGDVELRAGDTLLLQTTPNFARAHRNDPDFYLVSEVPEWRPLRRDKAWIAMLLFALLLLLMTTGWVDTAVAAMGIALAMVGCRCLSTGDARQSIEWQTLLTIGASFGIGEALRSTNAAALIAHTLVDWTQPLGLVVTLATIYFVGMLLTELITNNAVAVLLFPFCLEIAVKMDVSPRPLLVALMFSASACFATPIGYQTNMMVYGPGNYRFFDFMRVGLPLNLLLWGVATICIPIFWPWK